MKKTIIILLLIMSGNWLIAQQLPHFSQYYLNDYLINPAVSGSREYFEGKSGHRYQWEGITDAPRTYTLSVNGPIKSQKMGIGGYLFTDIVGPTRRTGFSLSYAYHLKIKETLKLSLGLSGGMVEFMIDGSRIKLRDDGDDILANSVQSVLLPDAGFGVYLYSEKYYFGISAPQLLNNKVKFFNSGINTSGILPAHYFITGGYKYDINDAFRIEPSVFLKYVSPAPVQIEGTIRVYYKQKIWLAGTYRSNDAITASLGYIINNSFTLAYAYDFTTTNIKNYITGTHEIMVGVRFYKSSKKED